MIFLYFHLFLSAMFLLSLLLMAFIKRPPYIKGDWKYILIGCTICLFAPYWVLVLGFIGYEKELAESLSKMKGK